ncbi:hypothetical protein Plhal304r1_c008g0033931 [Plasmopara halstedii]
MLITVSILLLVCSTSAYNSTRSTLSYHTAAGVPVDGGLVSISNSSAQNLSSFHETANKDLEERAHGGLLAKVSDMVAGLVRPVLAKYNSYVTSLNKYEDLDSVLTSPEMEGLLKFCTVYNRKAKDKNKLSPVAPLLVRFSNEELTQKLHHLSTSANGKMHMMRQLAWQHMNMIKKEISPSEIFEFLDFGDDLTEAIRNGKFGKLETYIIEHINQENKEFYLFYIWDVLLKILTTHFDGEANLVQQINKAKRQLEPDAKLIVRNLKARLIHRWRNSSPESVWHRLQFGPEAYDALTSGKLEIFHEYTAEGLPRRNHVPIMNFIKTYGEGDVTEALAKARMEPHLREFASKLYHERLNYWNANSYSLQRVYSLLEFANTDSANSALFKLETLTDFIWSRPDDATLTNAFLVSCSYQASATLKKNNSIVSHFSAEGLQDVLLEVWTRRRNPSLELFRELDVKDYNDRHGNVHSGVNPAHFDRDVPSIPFNRFNTPRRS